MPRIEPSIEPDLRVLDPMPDMPSPQDSSSDVSKPPNAEEFSDASGLDTGEMAVDGGEDMELDATDPLPLCVRDLWRHQSMLGPDAMALDAQGMFSQQLKFHEDGQDWLSFEGRVLKVKSLPQRNATQIWFETTRPELDPPK